MEKSLQPWLKDIFENVILPRRKLLSGHPFVRNLETGKATREDALQYFEGLMWHLLAFGRHVQHLMKKRPLEVAEFLQGRSEDEDGDTEILGRIISAFGGDPGKIARSPWTHSVHPVWIHHDALLRAAIYSVDLPWQVGAAALNVGIEALVPSMIEPLFRACVQKYGVSSSEAKWLESRAGEIEKQHGDNGFLLLNHFVEAQDLDIQAQCRFFIEALADSMTEGLLSSGLPQNR